MSVRYALGALWEAGTKAPELGPCCGCERKDAEVRAIVLLYVKGPVAGKGWGCFQCGLAADGATAALCLECLDAGRIARACIGYAKEGRRVPLARLTTPHDHDFAKHPELTRQATLN